MFPRKVEYWICSDKRTFTTEEEAIAHEEFLARQSSSPTSYCLAGNKNKPEIFEMWF